MAKAPNPTKVARAKAGPPPVLRMSFDGQSWDARREWTARQDMECRQAIGLPIAGALSLLEQGSFEAVAVIMWLARRQAGETVSLDSVIDLLDDVSKVDVEIVSEDEASPPDNGEH